MEQIQRSACSTVLRSTQIQVEQKEDRRPPIESDPSSFSLFGAMKMTVSTLREEAALDSLLRALVTHEQKRPSRSGPPRTVTPSTLSGRSSPTAAEAEVSHLMIDPVGAALRQAMKRIGDHLMTALGNTNALRDVLERVAGMEPAAYGRRAAVIDHAWNGIGRGGDMWWA